MTTPPSSYLVPLESEDNDTSSRSTQENKHEPALEPTLERSVMREVKGVSRKMLKVGVRMIVVHLLQSKPTYTGAV